MAGLNSSVWLVGRHGASLGTGHLSRLFSIAEWLVGEGYSTVCLTNSTDNLFVERLEAIGTTILISEGLDLLQLDIPNGLSYPNWCILDGDTITNEEELEIKGFLNCRTVRITDHPRNYAVSDCLINQNHGSEEFDYRPVENQRRFFGLRNVILRSNIRNVDKVKRSAANKLVTVTLGMSSLPQANSFIERVVTLFSEPHMNDTQVHIFSPNKSCVASLTEGQANLHSFGFSDRLVDSMRLSNFLICSAGSTMWESMALGIPFLPVCLTKEQDDYVKRLEEDEFCIAVLSSGSNPRLGSFERVVEIYQSEIYFEQQVRAFDNYLPETYFEDIATILHQ